jgi:hypothetical protein
MLQLLRSSELPAAWAQRQAPPEPASGLAATAWTDAQAIPRWTLSSLQRMRRAATPTRYRRRCRRSPLATQEQQEQQPSAAGANPALGPSA